MGSLLLLSSIIQQDWPCDWIRPITIISDVLQPRIWWYAENTRMNPERIEREITDRKKRREGREEKRERRERRERREETRMKPWMPILLLTSSAGQLVRFCFFSSFLSIRLLSDFFLFISHASLLYCLPPLLWSLLELSLSCLACLRLCVCFSPGFLHFIQEYPPTANHSRFDFFFFCTRWWTCSPCDINEGPRTLSGMKYHWTDRSANQSETRWFDFCLVPSVRFPVFPECFPLLWSTCSAFPFRFLHCFELSQPTDEICWFLSFFVVFFPECSPLLGWLVSLFIFIFSIALVESENWQNQAWIINQNKCLVLICGFVVFFPRVSLVLAHLFDFWFPFSQLPWVESESWRNLEWIGSIRKTISCLLNCTTIMFSLSALTSRVPVYLFGLLVLLCPHLLSVSNIIVQLLGQLHWWNDGIRKSENRSRYDSEEGTGEGRWSWLLSSVIHWLVCLFPLHCHSLLFFFLLLLPRFVCFVFFSLLLILLTSHHFTFFVSWFFWILSFPSFFLVFLLLFFLTFFCSLSHQSFLLVFLLVCLLVFPAIFLLDTEWVSSPAFSGSSALYLTPSNGFFSSYFFLLWVACLFSSPYLFAVATHGMGDSSRFFGPFCYPGTPSLFLLSSLCGLLACLFVCSPLWSTFLLDTEWVLSPASSGSSALYLTLDIQIAEVLETVDYLLHSVRWAESGTWQTRMQGREGYNHQADAASSISFVCRSLNWVSSSWWCCRGDSCAGFEGAHRRICPDTEAAPVPRR